MRDAFVRIRGVCTALTNEQHQLTAIRLLVPNPDQVTVEVSPPADFFALPESTIASLRLFDPYLKPSQWLRTVGVVTYHASGHFLVIQDNNEPLTVLLSKAAELHTGNRIEVVGTLGRDGVRRVLRNAEFRDLGPAPIAVEPVRLTLPTQPEAELDDRLVRFTGQLDEVTELGDEQYLEIRHSAGAIVARWHAAGSPIPTSWRRGSEVELTGVCRLLFDENRRRTGFELLLRTPSDLRILRAAPWWTSARARAARPARPISGLRRLWAVLLRRKVAQQTVLIRRPARQGGPPRGRARARPATPILGNARRRHRPRLQQSTHRHHGQHHPRHARRDGHGPLRRLPERGRPARSAPASSPSR
jgi:hypothetical protein